MLEELHRQVAPHNPGRAGRIAAWLVLGALILGAAGFMLGLMLTIGRAHEATDVNGQNLHIVYPPSCCNSAATSPTGDCAPISDEYVTERADGYHVNIPVGGHPKLITKGYVGIIPYSGVKQPIGNDYHICLSTDGAARYCFFPKPGAV
jgi:hypothetical protein